MIHFFGVDPSTKTGLAMIEEDGTLLDWRLVTSDFTKLEEVRRIDDIVSQVTRWITERYCNGDLICIESPSFASRGNYVAQQGALGYMMRVEMTRKGIAYIDAAPTQLKKFISGNAVEKKENLILPLFLKYGFQHKDDNVRDAFGLAQIARSFKTGNCLDSKQEEVIKKISGEV